MAIPYVVRRKKNPRDLDAKELWYAVAKTIQERGGKTEEDIVKRISGRTGFSPGVIEGVLIEAVESIEFFLKYGFTVNIKNLGSFQTALTSDGFEHPSQVTPGQVKLSRVYFVAGRKLTQQVNEGGFFKIPFSSYMPREFWEKEEEEDE